MFGGVDRRDAAAKWRNRLGQSSPNRRKSSPVAIACRCCDPTCRISLRCDRKREGEMARAPQLTCTLKPPFELFLLKYRQVLKSIRYGVLHMLSWAWRYTSCLPSFFPFSHSILSTKN